MNDKLREIYDEISRVYSQVTRRELGGKYRIGELVNRSEKRKYGEGAVGKLAEAMGVSPDVLYDCATVEAAFSPIKFEELCDKRNCGFRLSFTHFLESARIKTTYRNEVLQKAVTHRWTTAELAQYVSRDLSRDDKPRSQRKGFFSPTVGLKALHKEADLHCEKLEAVDEAVLDKLDKLSPKELPDAIKLLEKAESSQKQLVADLQQHISQMATKRQALAERLKVEEAKVKDITPARQSAPQETSA